MSKILSPFAAAGNDLMLVSGSFTTNGTNPPDPTLFRNPNEFISITRTGAGAFLIKFAEVYPQLVSKWADIALTAPGDFIPQFGLFTQATTGTPPNSPAQIVLNLNTAATPTDPPANTRVSFGFVFRTTSVET